MGSPVTPPHLGCGELAGSNPACPTILKSKNMIEIFNTKETINIIFIIFSVFIGMKKFFTGFRNNIEKDIKISKGLFELIQTFYPGSKEEKELLRKSKKIIDDNIYKKIKKEYNPFKINHIIGYISFIIFGLLSIHLFLDKDLWYILTTILSLIGLSEGLFLEENKEVSKKKFGQLYFYNKMEFLIGFFFVISGITSFYIFNKLLWPILLLFLGTIMILYNIKIKDINEDKEKL